MCFETLNVNMVDKDKIKLYWHLWKKLRNFNRYSGYFLRKKKCNNILWYLDRSAEFNFKNVYYDVLANN